MAFTIITQEEFQRHCELASEHPFYQTVEMAELLTKRGFSTCFVGLKDNDDLKISALLFTRSMLGGSHMEITYGPIITDRTFLTSFYKELKKYAKNNNVLQLVLRPYDTYQSFDAEGNPTSSEKHELIKQLTSLGYVHEGLVTGYSINGSDWHYLKDLSKLDESSLLKSFNKNSIRNIKNAKQLGVTVRTIEYNEIADFKQVIEDTGERRGFEDKDLAYYQKLYSSFKDKSQFLIAELNPQASLKTKKIELQNLQTHQSKTTEQQAAKLTKIINQLEPLANKFGNKTIVLAVMLLISTPKEAIYLFGGSYTDYQKFSAPFLLQYEAMLRTINQNIPTYNFLGIAGEFDGSDGVLRFKQNFNGYINRKMGIFRYYPNPIKYRLINCLKKIVYSIKNKKGYYGT